jgi:hypothetical protein
MRRLKNTSPNGLQRAPKVSSERYRIHVIDRAAQILDCFGFDHQELSVSEIGVKTGLHRSTAHRILIALEYNDLIQQNPENGKYRLGIKLFRLGHPGGIASQLAGDLPAVSDADHERDQRNGAPRCVG